MLLSRRGRVGYRRERGGRYISVVGFGAVPVCGGVALSG